MTRAALAGLEEQLGKVILGKPEVIRELVTALLGGEIGRAHV